jgi:hypothetical protein
VLKQYKVLFEHTGEYSFTAKVPVAEWNGQVNLSEHADAILSENDWRKVKVDRWAVHEVALPEWLSLDEWLRHRIAWRYTWQFGVPVTWPERWQRGIAYGSFTDLEKTAIIKLLSVKNFRSNFRRSLRDQLVEWLETDAEDREYPDPFSPKQWAALTKYYKGEAGKRSQAIYLDRNVTPDMGVPQHVLEGLF